MPDRFQRTYLLWKLKRERGLFILAAGFVATFAGLYYLHSTGIWAVSKIPPTFIAGTVTKMWQPAAFEDPTYFTLMQVKLEDGQVVQLRGRSKLINDCAIGEKVELLRYSGEGKTTYYRIGPRACVSSE